MSKRQTLKGLVRDPRYFAFLREYLENPPDSTKLPSDYARLPVGERARRYAGCMCRFPSWHQIFH